MKTVIEEKLNEIAIPENLHERCIEGVMKVKLEESRTEKGKVEEKGMQKNWMKKMAATAAVLAVGIVAVGSTTMADGIKGFFKDVTRFDGAVTGSQYVQATEEVEISISEVSIEGGKTDLSVELVFLNPDEVPFQVLEFVEIDTFEIKDAAGNTVVFAEDAGVTHSVNSGIVQLQIVIEEELKKGESYTFVIESFEGLKKADAPLEIKGMWECEFTVE